MKLMKRHTVLWVTQSVLAGVFVLAGITKIVLPADQLTAPGPFQFPAAFLRFIGACELAGAAAMILPGAIGIAPRLTPLGAGGLVIVMLGATIVNIGDGSVIAAFVTASLGILAAWVAYGRWREPTLRGRSATARAVLGSVGKGE